MTNLEKAVRDAAHDLHKAIKAAEEAGLRVIWPSRAATLPKIAVSETKKTVAAVEVKVPANAVPATVDKAGDAAQKAADKVVDKAAI